VPQNLSATAVSDNRIDLTWDASTDNVGVAGYNIYRDDVLVDTSPTNAYSDTGLASATLYEYEVSAFDAAANESARSAPDSATTAGAGDTDPPSVPQNLVATGVSDDRIDLAWDASTDNVGVAGYNIYRDDVLVDTSPTNAYSDIGLAIETEYEYEVSAFDAAANESARSAPDSATTAVARLSPEFVQRGLAGVQAIATTDAGFTYPSEDVRADDLLLAVIAVNDRGAAPDVADAAAGWTRLSEVQHGELALAVFYRQATGSEAGAVTPFDWSSSDGANDVALCQLYQFRYVDWTHGGPFVGAPVTVTGNLTSLGLPTVQTQGANGLAVAVVGMSDDLSGSLVASGATGGSWIAPRDRDNTTAADDAAVNVFVAPMAAAGTISGGAIAITPTTPQSSRSIAIGIALRGMVDPQATATLAVPIAAGADDARENPNTTVVNVSSTTLFVQSASMAGLRFTGLSAIAGKVIVQAHLQLTAVNSEGLLNNGAWTIRAEAANSAAPYAASNGNISGRPLTTASRTWTLPAWTAGDRTLRQRSPDMRSVVQEVSDRVGFGGVVNVVITNVGAAPTRTFAAFEHATLEEATLTVRYLP
jgi:chitodextrinase